MRFYSGTIIFRDDGRACDAIVAAPTKARAMVLVGHVGVLPTKDDAKYRWFLEGPSCFAAAQMEKARVGESVWELDSSKSYGIDPRPMDGYKKVWPAEGDSPGLTATLDAIAAMEQAARFFKEFIGPLRHAHRGGGGTECLLAPAPEDHHTLCANAVLNAHRLNLQLVGGYDVNVSVGLGQREVDVTVYAPPANVKDRKVVKIHAARVPSGPLQGGVDAAIAVIQAVRAHAAGAA